MLIHRDGLLYKSSFSFLLSLAVFIVFPIVFPSKYPSCNNALRILGNTFSCFFLVGGVSQCCSGDLLMLCLWEEMLHCCQVLVAAGTGRSDGYLGHAGSLPWARECLQPCGNAGCFDAFVSRGKRCGCPPLPSLST